MRVRLLGEDLVAFRDSQGHIGLVDEYCPHRRASLWFGRNEEGGLRCVYHGWKFAVDGSCVEQMNEPEPFCHKVHLTAYPTAELGGVVWAYMGPPERTPALPKFAWTQAPESHRHVSKVIQECNWLQALEGGLDTSHAPIMHRLLKDNAGRGGINPSSAYVRAKAPSIVVDLTDYGYQYAGIRALGDDEQHIRTYHYILPFHQIRASRSETGSRVDAGHIWVPIDDENDDGLQLAVQRHRRAAQRRGPARTRHRQRAVACRPDDVSLQGQPRKQLPDRPRGAKRPRASPASTASTSRTARSKRRWAPSSTVRKEHLGPADKAIIQLRRLLRQAVNTAMEGGAPAGIRPSYYELRAAETVVPRAADWRGLVSEGLAQEKILQTV